MKKIRRISLLLTVALLAVMCFAFTAGAEDLVYGDYTYTVLEDETVKITGYNGTEADVVIPNEIDGKAVTVIGRSAFNYESELESLVISGTVKEIEKSGIHGCQALTAVTIEEGALENVYNTSIDECYALKTVNLPSNVVSIGNFLGCTALEEINVSEENESLKSVDGIVYSADMKALVRYPQAKKLDKYFIPDTVEVIKGNAFYEAREYVNVYIPLSVKTIEEFAFAYGKAALFYEGSEIPEQWEAAIAGRSVTLNAFPLGKTSKITSIQNTSALRLTWDAVNGADGYRIYLKVANGWKNVGTTVNTSVTYSNLKPGTRFTFAVKAGKIADGKVVWADTYTTFEASTQAVAPAKITVAQNTSAIRLTWTACPGATGYRIFTKSGNGWEIALNATAATSHTFTGLKAGSKFTYAVRPYILTKDVLIWSKYTEYTASTLPAAPTVAVSSPAVGQIKLSWSACPGADGYNVYFKVNGGAYKLYKTYTSAQSLTFSNLKGGDKYTFAVRAGIRTSGGVIWSSFEEKSVTLAYRIQRYLNAIKNGTYYIETHDGEGYYDGVALKNGNVCMRINYVGEVARIVYNKNTNLVYDIYDNEKIYAVYEDDGSFAEMASELSGFDVNMKISKSTTEKIGSKTYFVETQITEEGFVDKYYFDGANLVMEKLSYEGESIVFYYSKFTTNVPESLFTIPSNYTKVTA